MSTEAIDDLICAQVFSKMCMKLDMLDDPGVVKFFTSTAVWHRQGKTLDGHAGILAALKERPPNLFVQHILHQVVCEHQPDGVIQAHAYMSVYRKDPPQKITPPLPAQAPDMLLIWDAEFSKHEGSWLIHRLDNRPLYR